MTMVLIAFDYILKLRPDGLKESKLDIDPVTNKVRIAPKKVAKNSNL